MLLTFGTGAPSEPYCECFPLLPDKRRHPDIYPGAEGQSDYTADREQVAGRPGLGAYGEEQLQQVQRRGQFADVGQLREYYRRQVALA